MSNVPKNVNERAPVHNAMLAKQGVANASKKQQKKLHKKQFLAERSHAVDRARQVAQVALAARAGSFVSVSTDEKGKVTTAAVASPSLMEVSMAKEFMKTSLGTKPYKVLLTQQFAVQTSSANTALTTSLALDLTNTNEWSSFAAIFDEVRCIETSVQTIVTSGSAKIQPSTIPVFAMAINLNTTVSLASILVSTRHIGPVSLVSNSDSALTNMIPPPVSHNGYFEVKSGKLMVGAIGAATSSTNAPIQGDWISTAATAGQAIVNYCNQYVDAGGGSVITYTRSFGYYLVEFRLRQ